MVTDPETHEKQDVFVQFSLFYLWLVAYRQLRLTGFPLLTVSVKAAMQQNNEVHPLQWVCQTYFQLINHSHPFKPGVRYPQYDLIRLSDGHNNTGLIFEQHSGTHHFLSSCPLLLHRNRVPASGIDPVPLLCKQNLCSAEVHLTSRGFYPQ